MGTQSEHRETENTESRNRVGLLDSWVGWSETDGEDGAREKKEREMQSVSFVSDLGGHVGHVLCVCWCAMFGGWVGFGFSWKCICVYLYSILFYAGEYWWVLGEVIGREMRLSLWVCDFNYSIRSVVVVVVCWLGAIRFSLRDYRARQESCGRDIYVYTIDMLHCERKRVFFVCAVTRKTR